LPEHPDAASAWQAVSAALRRRIGESAYEIWLSGVQPVDWDGATLLLDPPQATARWLEGRFGPLLDACAAEVLGPRCSTSLRRARPAAGDRPPGAEAWRASPAGDGLRGGAGRWSDRRAGPGPRDTPIERAELALHPRYTFEQFVIGEGNRLAHAAALAVAELPGQAYNPLFIHAAPGMGKTHLLHAIGNYVLAFGAGARVRYTTAEAFTNHFIASLGSRSLDAFKRAYRDADVLLIDDVQFLASKARTEEEFFHTFNALHETGRQLVLTCDRLPRALTGLEQRLRERFEAGLVADISPPDRATRLAILRKRASIDRVHVACEEALELIADRVTDSVRSLEGALVRVVAFHSLTRRPIDRALTLEVLDSMYPSTQPSRPSIDAIQRAVAAHFQLSVSELTSARRGGDVAWARHVAIHLARELTGSSLPVIGRAFGGRNHATILNACRRVSERMRSDQQAVEEIRTLCERISSAAT